RFSLAFMCCSLTFFFFQAEDGIRDRNVTGVQTCALPISHSPPNQRTATHFPTAFRPSYPMFFSVLSVQWSNYLPLSTYLSQFPTLSSVPLPNWHSLLPFRNALHSLVFGNLQSAL